MNIEERQVRDFYDKYGWVNPESAAFFNDFSRAYYPYHERVNARTIQCFSGLNGRLLLAGGGNLPETHFAICDKFPETTCLDISKVAIDIAKSKTQRTSRIHCGIHFADSKTGQLFRRFLLSPCDLSH